MTKEQFIEAWIKDGYKEHECANNDLEVFKKRNKRIDIYCGGDYYNVYYEKQVKSGSIEYNQHRVTDYAKALKNIKNFERKLKR